MTTRSFSYSPGPDPSGIPADSAVDPLMQSPAAESAAGAPAPPAYPPREGLAPAGGREEDRRSYPPREEPAAVRYADDRSERSYSREELEPAGPHDTAPRSYAPREEPRLDPHDATPRTHTPREEPRLDPHDATPRTQTPREEPRLDPHDATPRSHAPREEPAPADPQESYTNPVDGLVHAAVADRPLEEVLQLITLLEQSPEYARATVDALRAVGVDRSVEDVTRLVALLTRPPRNADCADEAIRAAAECRPVEDVTRLMALLHRPPLEPHCGEEAVRAAASRPIEELVQLIGRLAQEQHEPVRAVPAPEGRSDAPPTDAAAAIAAALQGTQGTQDARRRTPRTRRTRSAVRGTTPPPWPRWLAAAALVMCGMAYFPLHRDGASANAYGFALGVSGLCVLLAVTLTLRGSLPVLSVCVMVPSALAALQLFQGRLHSQGLTRALDISAAPPWFAGLIAVLAALTALMAMLAALPSERLGRRPEDRALAGANHTVE